MSLVSTVEALQKRPCTPEEISNLAELQNLYRISDDDPLIVVLALMARSQLMVGTLPDLLQQKAIETIELHRTVLREQSVLISKELITTIAQNIQSMSVGWKVGWIRYASFFVAGMVTSALVFLAKYLPAGG
jgi:hypothetical protein